MEGKPLIKGVRNISTDDFSDAESEYLKQPDSLNVQNGSYLRRREFKHIQVATRLKFREFTAIFTILGKKIGKITRQSGRGTSVARDTLHEIEFFREAFMLVPARDSQLYETVLIPEAGKKKLRLFCSCSPGRDPKCTHAKQLLEGYTTIAETFTNAQPDSLFNKSIYRQIFGAIARVAADSVQSVTVGDAFQKITTVSSKNTQSVLLNYNLSTPTLDRFISRLSPLQKFSRAWLLDKAATFVESEYERSMRISGHKTVRMVEESGFWYRLAYHCFREFDEADLAWKISVDRHSGTVWLAASRNAIELFSVALPEKAVVAVIDILEKNGHASPQWNHGAFEKELLFRIKDGVNQTVVVEPSIDLFENSERTIVPVSPCFCYGALVYHPDSDRFYRFTYDSLQRCAEGWNSTKIIAADAFSDYLIKHLPALSIASVKQDEAGCEQVDLFTNAAADDLGRIATPPVIDRFDHIELHPIAQKGCLWTIEIMYRAGEVTINLAQLLAAYHRKEHYCFTGNAIVNCKSPSIKSALAQSKGIGTEGTISISNMSLMLLGSSSLELKFEGDEKLTKKIKNMFAGKPKKEDAPPPELLCTLRPYQSHGVNWLQFLYDYHLGGLLCDEMGLGKTIQVIAAVTTLNKRHHGFSTCIVCPTSVISHWKNLLERFSPHLRVIEYAQNRKLPLKSEFDVVLLSYGIMRNDGEVLAHRHFDLLVFDEIHQLKNRNTAGYRAACQLRSRVVIGLTGTPVENCADDLHALFNLVLPGLHLDIPSESALLTAVHGSVDTKEIHRFRRRIAPFMLRRVKSSVALELPEKITENRICSLSPYQAELYREALLNKGAPLLESLRENGTPIPYMHIFSLLTHLKQLCNTPALTSGKWDSYTLYESGKWELFKELLDESLGSGAKVVVFTQYLEMVEIFSHYLASIRIDHVTLTGSTKHRQQVISRFAKDPDCKVFIGSLKAGGVGIDLIAASVVIHYDRWWNAAREDQATDRVHRIGQTRGVQVFKLITENTVEERINRIIEHKKELSEVTLSEDDPESTKMFTREELMELLTE